MANEVEIPLKLSGIEKIKAELKDLKQSIIEVGGEAAMAELVKRAAELSKEIENANDQVAEMSKGSGLNKVSEAFNEIKEDINSIDFAGATKAMDKMSEASAETARSFEKGATFAERYGEELQPLTTRLGEAEDRLYELALAGEKTSQEYQDLLETVSRYRKVQIETDQVVDGASQTMAQKLGGSLGGVTSAFELAQGAAGAFGASGEAIEKSLLKVQSAAAIAQGFQGIKEAIPSVKALSASFKGLGATILSNPIFLIAAVIAAIVVGIGIFLNKIGVLQKVLDFLMIPINALIDAFKELTDWLGLTSFAAEENARKMEEANEKAFKSSEKRTEKISDQYDIEIARAKSAGKETVDLEIEKSKRVSEAARVRLQTARNEYNAIKKLTDEDSVERRKKLLERIENESKIIKDGSKERIMLQLNEQAEQRAEQEKAAAEAKAKAAERAKAYKDGAAAIQKEINAANKLVIDSGKTQQQKEVDDVKAKYDALIKEAQKYKKDTTALETARGVEISAINKTFADQELERQKNLAKQLTDFKNAELDREEAIQEAIYQVGLTARQKEVQEKQYYYEGLIAEAMRYGQDTKALVDAQSTELAAINKKYDDEAAQASKEKALKQIEDEKAIRDAKIEIASSVANGLGAIGEAFIKDQKKLEKFNKAQALIQIGIDTAKAISSLVAMSQANPLNTVTGGAAGIAQYAAGIVQIVTNIAKAKALLSNPSSTPSTNNPGTGGGGDNAAAASSVPSFVPGNLFGQGNAANNVGAPQSMETSQNITVTAVVSETEMTATQNKVNKIMKNSVL